MFLFFNVSGFGFSKVIVFRPRRRLLWHGKYSSFRTTEMLAQRSRELVEENYRLSSALTSALQQALLRSQLGQPVAPAVPLFQASGTTDSSTPAPPPAAAVSSAGATFASFRCLEAIRKANSLGSLMVLSDLVKPTADVDTTVRQVFQSRTKEVPNFPYTETPILPPEVYQKGLSAKEQVQQLTGMDAILVVKTPMYYRRRPPGLFPSQDCLLAHGFWLMASGRRLKIELHHLNNKIVLIVGWKELVFNIIPSQPVSPSRGWLQKYVR